MDALNKTEAKLTKMASTHLAKMHKNEHSQPNLTKLSKTQLAKTHQNECN